MSAVVTDLYSTLLQTGITASIAGGVTGPKIDITGFQIGSLSAADGAVADKTATGVDNWVYTDPTINNIYYAELPDSDACLFRVILDESVGNFTVGQICLMIGATTAYSKSVLYQPQKKWKSNLPGLFGNNVSFDIVLAISDAQSCINLTMLTPLYASLPEVTDETLLPAATSSIYNSYLCRNHTRLGVPVIAVRRNGVWSFTIARAVAGQGDGVLAINPALVDPSVSINMAVYFDFAAQLFLPADANNEDKFPIGILTSTYEVTQTGYVTRYANADIWPGTIVAKTSLYVTPGNPGVPSEAVSYQHYGYVADNNTIYVDFAGEFKESAIVQNGTIAGAIPMSKSHRHPMASETVDGFMSYTDKLKLDHPENFVIGNNGISTVAGSTPGTVTVTAEGATGFLVGTDAMDSHVIPGNIVALKLIGGIRTWVVADPLDYSKRPLGIITQDMTRVIIDGEVTITASAAWPLPLVPGNIYEAGTLTAAGNLVPMNTGWVMGEAVNTNTFLIQMPCTAHLFEHLDYISTPDLLTAGTNQAYIKAATPGGVAGMISSALTNFFNTVVLPAIHALDFSPFLRRDTNTENIVNNKITFKRDATNSNRGMLTILGQDDTGNGGVLQFYGPTKSWTLQTDTTSENLLVVGKSSVDGVIRTQAYVNESGDFGVQALSNLFTTTALWTIGRDSHGVPITGTTASFPSLGSGSWLTTSLWGAMSILIQSINTRISTVLTDGVTIQGNGVTVPISIADTFSPSSFCVASLRYDPAAGIVAGFNIASVVPLGGGVYSVTMVNPLPTLNYHVHANEYLTGSSEGGWANEWSASTRSNTQFQIHTWGLYLGAPYGYNTTAFDVIVFNA